MLLAHTVYSSKETARMAGIAETKKELVIGFKVGPASGTR